MGVPKEDQRKSEKTCPILPVRSGRQQSLLKFQPDLFPLVSKRLNLQEEGQQSPYPEGSCGNPMQLRKETEKQKALWREGAGMCARLSTISGGEAWTHIKVTPPKNPSACLKWTPDQNIRECLYLSRTYPPWLHCLFLSFPLINYLWKGAKFNSMNLWKNLCPSALSKTIEQSISLLVELNSQVCSGKEMVKRGFSKPLLSQRECGYTQCCALWGAT